MPTSFDALIHGFQEALSWEYAPAIQYTRHAGLFDERGLRNHFMKRVGKELHKHAMEEMEHAQILSDIARNATKPNVFQGEVISESPDWTNRLAAIKEIDNVKGVVQKQKSVEVHMSKTQTLIVNLLPEEQRKLPDKKPEEIEAEFIAKFEKEQED